MLTVTVLGQRVKEGVSGRIVGLAGGADNARRRGKQYKRGQLGVLGEVMQMPGASALAAKHGIELVDGSGR